MQIIGGGVCNQLDLLIQYIKVFAVFFNIWLVHSLQVMMSTHLIYYLILPFGVIFMVKCLFAMSNAKGWERKYSLTLG